MKSPTGKFVVSYYYDGIGWNDVWWGKANSPRQAATNAGIDLHPRKTIKINKVYKQGKQLWKVKNYYQQPPILTRLWLWLKHKIDRTPNILQAV